MATISIYNQEGKDAGKLELNDALFNVEVNPALLHEAVVMQRASSRQVLSHAKGRSEVRGGGKKPWRQKGTGRARHGSIRSPIWKGGGVTFGPSKFRNFAKKMNRKARQKALRMAVTNLVKNDRMIVVDSLELAETKTKMMHGVLSRLPKPELDTLIIVANDNRTVGVAARNLANVDVLPVGSLNVIDLLKARRVVTSKQAIEEMDTIYAKK